MDTANEKQLFENNKSQRILDYKCRSIVNDQESRRYELLQNQKRLVFNQ